MRSCLLYAFCMSGCTPRLPKVLTCSEVDDNVNEEDGVRDAVEDHPSHGEVIVEEGDSPEPFYLAEPLNKSI